MILEESVNTNGNKVYLFNGNTFTSKDSFWLQMTRVTAIFLGGPFLIYVAFSNINFPNYYRIIFFILGVLAIWSNSLSYLRELE